MRAYTNFVSALHLFLSICCLYLVLQICQFVSYYRIDSEFLHRYISKYESLWNYTSQVIAFWMSFYLRITFLNKVEVSLITSYYDRSMNNIVKYFYITKPSESGFFFF